VQPFHDHLALDLLRMVVCCLALLFAMTAVRVAWLGFKRSNPDWADVLCWTAHASFGVLTAFLGFERIGDASLSPYFLPFTLAVLAGLYAMSARLAWPPLPGSSLLRHKVKDDL